MNENMKIGANNNSLNLSLNGQNKENLNTFNQNLIGLKDEPMANVEANNLGQSLVDNGLNDNIFKASVGTNDSKEDYSIGQGIAIDNKDNSIELKTNFDKSLNASVGIKNEANDFMFLDSGTNLSFRSIKKSDVSKDEPFSSIKMASDWLREATDFGNYWNAIESMGAEVARYKFNYDEGKMGKFDLKEFSKEFAKSSVRSLGSNTMNMFGNMAVMLGYNLKDDEDVEDSDFSKVILPKVSETLLNVGNTFKKYASDVENLSFLAPRVDLSNDDPSFMRLANVLGSSCSQVLAMGAVSKVLGTAGTYGLFASGGASDVFVQSYEKDANLDKANALAVASGGVSFAIDKILNPLPKVVEQNAKITSKLIAKEMIGAPLREASSEILQQMLAENLVRKIGIDDTQDLFEGLIESALGSMAGSVLTVGASGAVYNANKALDEVKKRIYLKGVSKEDFELAKKDMLLFMEQKPQAFDKILGYNLKKNLENIENEAKEHKSKKEYKNIKNDVKGFEVVYDKMKDRFMEALGDEAKAGAAARMFEANALSLYQADAVFSPYKYLQDMLPKVKSSSFSDFVKNNKSKSVAYQFVGTKAKGLYDVRLAKFLKLEEKGDVSKEKMWELTGWFRGSDGKLRSEIDDSGAKIKLWDDKMIDSYDAKSISKGLVVLESFMAECSASLKFLYENRYGPYYREFYEFLEEKSKSYDKNEFAEIVAKSLKLNADEDKKLNTDDEVSDVGEKVDAEEMLVSDKNGNKKFDVVKVDAVADFTSALNNKIGKENNNYIEGYRNEEKNDEKIKIKNARSEYNERLMALEDDFFFNYYDVRDYNEEESKYLNSKLDDLEYRKFEARYWDKRRNAPTVEFYKLQEEKILEYKDDEKFNQALALAFKDVMDKTLRRSRKIKEKGIADDRSLFVDLEKEHTYRQYKIFNGDFQNLGKKDSYFPKNYLKLYEPTLNADLFLAQDKFSFLDFKEKRSLSSNLSNVESIFNLYKAYEEMLSSHHQYMEYVNRDTSNWLNNKDRKSDRDFSKEEIENLKLRDAAIKNGVEMKLGDILEHELLFNSYPEMADVVVRFAKLNDKKAEHFYFDNKDGYVLEFDAEQLDYDNVLEQLLRGTQFVIQDIEGFDYGLSFDERRNFMDRQIHLAKKSEEGNYILLLREFVKNILPEYSVGDFLVEKIVPISMMGLASSAVKDLGDIVLKEVNYSEVGNDKLDGILKEKVEYSDIDFAKLEGAVKKKYADFLFKFVDEDDKFLKNYAYWYLQKLKSDYHNIVYNKARENGGYSFEAFPWTGVTSQGAIEMRAMRTHLNDDVSDKNELYFEYLLGQSLNLQNSSKNLDNKTVLSDEDKLKAFRAFENYYDKKTRAYIDDSQVQKVSFSGGREGNLRKIDGGVIFDITYQNDKEANLKNINDVYFEDPNFAKKLISGANPELKSDLTLNDEILKAKSEVLAFKPEVIEAFDEFYEISENDRKNFEREIINLAKGAYDEADKTIHLFKNADAETIVHETFHYFGDLLEKANLKNNMEYRLYEDALNDLKLYFLKNYYVHSLGNKFFAYNVESKQVMEELQVGFSSYDELYDAAVKELFVKRFMDMLNGKIDDIDNDYMSEAVGFYGRWLNNVVKNLEIDSKESGKGGKKLLKFIKNKIK